MNEPAEETTIKQNDSIDELTKTDLSDQPTDAAPSKSGVKWYRRKKLVLGLGIFFSFVGLITALVVPSIVIGNQLRDRALIARNQAGYAMDALRLQDLQATENYLSELRESTHKLRSDYSRLRYWQYTPLKWHYEDIARVLNSIDASVYAGQVTVKTIEPYSDIIGFGGEESFMEGTAEERIVKVIETLDKVVPVFDNLEEVLAYIESQIGDINPDRYPISFEGQQQIFANLAGCTGTPYTQGTHTASELVSLTQDCIHQARSVLADFRPVLEALPDVAGSDEPKTYLVMFQNDGELRPTGGFMTAYAILEVESGKVTPISSDDIYDLDAKFRSNPPPPPPIEKYLPSVLVWNLRDMNLSPDFRNSIELFLEHYQTVPGEPEIDGVIAVDTKVLTRLIEVLGPVEVPGYGTFTAEIEPRCDCPQVVYSLENMITRPTPYHRSDRKGVLGPLMQTILNKAYGAPKQVYPELFGSIIELAQQKHMLFYFFDEQAQAAAETINVAGRINPPGNQDFLHINDANFGGAKSNMFVTQEVEQNIEIENNQVSHQLNIVYKNPRPADNCNLEAGELCLNGVLPNWVRVYLPLGSELVEARGFREDSVEVSEDLGLTVIEGFFTLNPQAQARVTIEYISSHQPTKDGIYTQFIQKQPGTKSPDYTVTVNGISQDFQLQTDKELRVDYQ